jgi:hypothetical protein
VMGLPWEALNSREHFGMPVDAALTFQQSPEPLHTQAVIIREYSIAGEQMGLKFHMSPENRALLAELIRKNGFYPTDHMRKYPRLPATSSISTFPLRALVQTHKLEGEATNDQPPIIFDVGNLSPNGILLATESQLSLSIVPNQRLQMILEPRGSFPHQVKVQGLVCRITDSTHFETGNLTRYLGIKFTKVDEMNRAAFLDLLKDILERMKMRAGI